MTGSAGPTTVSDRPVERVCVLAQLHLPGLGDLIQRNIMLALLRRAYPGASVTLVVGEHLAGQYAELLAGHTWATDVLVCPDPLDAEPSRWHAFLDRLAAGRFDTCLVDPGSHTLGARHARTAGIGTRLGFPKNGTGPFDPDLTHPIHLSRSLFGFPDLYEYACALATAVGLDRPRPHEVVPRLPYQPQPLPELAVSGPRVAVHPTGQPHWNRRWPLRRYEELCARLVTAAGASLHLLGTAVERPELDRLRDGVLTRSPGAVVHVDTDSGIGRAANLIAGMDLFVGNDSGLAHLAAAVGTHSAVVYGPTGTELLWSRIYPRHRGASLHYACQAITHEVDQVAARRCAYDCVVAYRGPDAEYPRCLTDLTVEQVWAVVQAQLRAASETVGGSHAG